MNTHQIIEITLVNEGITLDSVDLEPTTHTSGYYVGNKGLRFDPKDIASIAKAIEACRNNSGLIGTWLERDSIYIDSTTWIESLSQALELAKVRGELAIWDVANSVSIYL